MMVLKRRSIVDPSISGGRYQAMKTAIHGLALLTIASIVVGACGTPAPGNGDTKAEQNRLVLTIVTGESNPEEATAFASAVAKVSGGAIELNVNNTLVALGPAYETDVIKTVTDGKAQLGFVAARAFDMAGVKSFVGLHAPFLIDSYGLEEQVLTSDWGQALLGHLRPAGIVGIGYLQGAMRRPLAYSHALVDLADYEGARIGIRASALTEATFRALGATPIVFQPGVTRGLDGMEVHPSQIRGANYDVGAHSLTGNIVFWPRPGVVFANAKVFDGLTPEQQATLREAATDAFGSSVASVKADQINAAEALCARGLATQSASAAAAADLMNAVQPVYEEIEKDPSTKATIDSIRGLKASLDATPETITCGAAAHPSASTAIAPADVIDSPIVGTYATSFTRTELAASPLLYDKGELNNGNWGDLTLAFGRDGRVTMTQSNVAESSSTSGTYTLHGDHIDMNFNTGSNVGANFSGRWSLFRDTLTFERVGDEELPTPYLVKSWTRVS